MRKVIITVMRKGCYADFIDKYENPIENPCDMEEGMRFVFYNDETADKPEGLCDSAWETIRPFALDLAEGAHRYFPGWMKNPDQYMISCNDGFRPVSFLLEAAEDIS